MSRAAVAFATDVIARFGEPVSDVQADLVRVPLSQHELAQRYDCAPSTVRD